MLKKYRLPNQLPGEEIVKIIRKDIFVLFKRIMFFFFLVLLPFGFFLLILFIFPGMLNGSISYPLVVLGASSYYLFVWLLFFFSFIDYYLDIWIITNERIIDVKQEGFFSRIISEQRLYRVQDVTSEIEGILPTIFNYGDVHIQTAGEIERFWFSEVPDPENIRDIIVKLTEFSRKAHHDTE
jgi:uncharacterized membrane protein YdbT with pleckstrin-like domain